MRDIRLLAWPRGVSCYRQGWSKSGLDVVYGVIMYTFLDAGTVSVFVFY